MSLIIEIPNETNDFEHRVALTPEAVKKIRAAWPDVAVKVEKNAGAAAGYPDEAYVAAGAQIGSGGGALVMRVTSPSDAKGYEKDALLLCLSGPDMPDVSRLALEKLPRTSRAQALDVLSSQANLAGYAAVLKAVGKLPRLMPLLMTAAGASRPATVVVVGVGVAGLQAIATAKRLGAQVWAFDVRPETAEQIKSLGAKPIAIEAPAGEKNGVYAQTLSAAEQKALQEKLQEVIAKADVVIATAQVPGKPAPVLVSEEAVLAMQPGSVVLDMAAGGFNKANNIKGGNCPLSVADKEVTTDNGVTIIADTYLTSSVAGDASRFWANNMVNLLKLLLRKDGDRTTITYDDELITAMRVVA
ncbi:MAG TPA: NAD(P)(+) transhydrogenase (Re/Si-specific) subunit alpha [Alphaproteobacteria bacterium]|nr:NAD(P)(+) transhydrogenase (Re/Si-specific) subunit alpha [Alphaproteobacteria bacterium]